jgi:hypothetical protein
MPQYFITISIVISMYREFRKSTQPLEETISEKSKTRVAVHYKI